MKKSFPELRNLRQFITPLAIIGTLVFVSAALSLSPIGGPRHPTQDINLQTGNEELDRPLTPEALKEDFSRLRASLEEGHAGLYRYTPKPEMDAHFDALEKKLDRPMTLAAFYGEVLQLVAAIRDGHSAVNPPARLTTAFYDLPIRPPFALHYEGERVRILRDGSGETPSAVGWEVVAINDRPIKTITEKLFAYLRGDGFSRSGRRLRLQDPETFARLHFLAYGIPDHFVFKLRSSKGEERHLKVKGLSRGEMRRALPGNRPRSSGPPASFRFDGDVGVFTLRTFGSSSLSRAGIDYPEFLEDMFRSLVEKKAEALIIDVRDNSGGSDPYGLFLYAHLAESSFRYYDRLEMNRERYEFLRWTGMQNPDRAMAAVRRDDKGRLVRTDHPNLGIKEPRQPVYRGPIFALVNGGSFSATGEFLSILRANRRGLLIGEESGAGRTGNTSGISIGLSLPNSGITVFIPMVGYYMAGDPGPHPERGLLPDHEVFPTVEDVLEGRDPVMEYALRLARAGK